MDQEKLKQFRKQSVEKALRAGLPAYFLDECADDGVIRIKPDGIVERTIVQQGRAHIRPLERQCC